MIKCQCKLTDIDDKDVFVWLNPDHIKTMIGDAGGTKVWTANKSNWLFVHSPEQIYDMIRYARAARASYLTGLHTNG
jgi:hypothetical protein